MPPRQKQPRTQPMRVYESGKRHMELIASVSRSSGLEKDGDALRNFNVQEQYREFIQGKLDDYWKRYPYEKPPTDTKNRDEMQSNLLILFRKLREGILATKRKDDFALEVYETSMHLSIIFGTPAQTTSVISHLVPNMYDAHSELHKSCSRVSIISLVYFLVAAYPSQSRYSDHLNSLPATFVSSSTRSWLRELSRCIRQHNFARLEQLTNRHASMQALNFEAHVPLTGQPPSAPQGQELAQEALSTLLDTLRMKARDTTWTILRSAYRELHCPKPTNLASMYTRDWLLRSLLLRSVACKEEVEDDIALVDTWVQERAMLGEMRPKENTERRWIVCKVNIR